MGAGDGRDANPEQKAIEAARQWSLLREWEHGMADKPVGAVVRGRGIGVAFECGVGVG